MKKIILFVFCIMLFASGAITANSAQQKTQNKFAAKNKNSIIVEEEKVKTKKAKMKTSILCGYSEPMRVGGYVTNPPFGWVTMIPASSTRKEQYLNEGFSYDLFTQLADNIGLKVRNQGYASFQEALRDLQKGKLDVVVGSYYDRRVLRDGTNLMFPGYFANPILTLFVKGRERPVNSWEDLRGLKGVVRQEELIYSLIYNQIPKDLKIEQVSGSKKAFTKLLTGEADYMITSLYAGEAEVRRYKLIDEIYFSPKALVAPELFFVFSSHTDCRKHKGKLAAELKKILSDKDAYMKTLTSYIDEWGMRFKDRPSLIEEIRAEREKALYSEQQPPEKPSDEAALVETEENFDMDFTASSDAADTADSSDSVNTRAPLASEDKSVSAPMTSSDKTTDTKSHSGSQSEPANRPLSPAERIKNL